MNRRMDFKFKKNIYGQSTAIFSMEHEVIGRWLNDEIYENQPKISEILILIEKLEQGRIGFKEIIGSEFQLSMSHTGVEIKALSLDADYPDFNDNSCESDEPFEYGELYDKESYAECGLLDFKLVLLSWQEYINE